ncbi:MAG: tetratricopeptide repeat protein [Candidatus Omnitrophota bacterium]|nr:tetratricopeptide repeat protein [Candidatus Omnitrophota bacterium]
MPKRITYSILILFICALIFSFLDYRGEYLAERKLFFANKTLSNILKNQESVPSALYEKTAKQYKYIISKYPKTISAKGARLLLGRFYISRKEFDAARLEFNKILNQYPEDKNYCAQALFAIGNSYESEDKWNQALSTYENIMNNYIGTPLAMNMPIYIANRYAQKKDDTNKNSYFSKAIEYYQKIAGEYPNTQLGYIAMNSRITCLELMGNWNAALEALQVMVNNYPNTPSVINGLKMIGIISFLKLKQPQRAVDIYKDFISRHPKHKLNTLLEKQINTIKNQMDKKEGGTKGVSKSAQPQEQK